MSTKIRCPRCKKVGCVNYDTRETTFNRIRRRKICNHCGYRYVTYEVYIPDGADVKDYWKMFKREMNE